MDLRTRLDGSQINVATRLLNYQPFLLSDDVQTGVAYSWVNGGNPRVAPPLVFRRSEFEPEWIAISDANARLRTMYDDLLDAVAERFPRCSLLDVACNNGYFPVGACLRGMKGYGIDLGDYSSSVRFLNQALGTKAKFSHASYDSRRHELAVRGRYDVTVLMAIMCHLPDPLNFLAAIGRITDKAILFWGQLVDTDRLMIAFNPPHPSLSDLRDFPHNFNDNTRLSRALFDFAMDQLGFRHITEITPQPTWLQQLHRPTSGNLTEELTDGSRHVALLATR
jgi:SAM-dependent methyltransferase